MSYNTYAGSTSSLLEVLDNIVEVSRQNPSIRELARRLQDPSVRASLGESRQQLKQEPTDHAIELAQRMLKSDWPMNDFYSMSPRMVRDFIENVSTGFTTEERMTEGQAKLWSSCRSKFHRYERQFA